MPDWSVNHLAAKAVALHYPGTLAERREVLLMLGLIAPDGTLAPDDTRTYDIVPLGDTADPVSYNDPPVDRTTVPPGLANYTPRPVTPSRGPKPARAPKPAALVSVKPSTASARKRPPAPEPSHRSCGTLGGRGVHLRRGEPLCRCCKEAQATYQREARRKKATLAAKPLPQPPEGSYDGEEQSA